MTYEEIVRDFVEISRLLRCYADEGTDQEKTISLLKSQYLPKNEKNVESFINTIQSIIFIDQTKTVPMMTLLKTLTTETDDPKDSSTELISQSLIEEINKQIINICVKDVKIFGIKPNNVFLNFYQNCTIYGIQNLKDPIKIGKIVFENDDISSVFRPLSKELLELNPNFSLKEQEIEYFIEKDDVNSLQNYCVTNAKNFSPEHQLNTPINHRYSKLVTVDNYLSLSALFGSIKCFKYLFLNFKFADSNTNIFYSAIIGGNSEILHILHNSSYNNTGSAHIAMILNQKAVFEWLLMNPIKNNPYCNKEDSIFLMNPNLQRKYIKYLVRLDYFPDYDLNSETKVINDEYYKCFLSLSRENNLSHCINGLSNLHTFLHYCIKYHNIQLFVFYFELMNEKERNKFLTNQEINNVYKSSVLEFCLFYRSYDIISYLISFYPLKTKEELIQSDFNLTEIYGSEKFMTVFNEQRNLTTTSNNDTDNIIKDNIGIGNAFVKKNSHFYKMPMNKSIRYFPELGCEIHSSWEISELNNEKPNNIKTGKIFMLRLDQKIRRRQKKKIQCSKHSIRKPIIYLYPKKVNEKDSTRIEVKVELVQDQFTCTYPKIGADGKWIVQAKPDGTLLNEADNQEYQSLYWESTTSNRFKAEFKKGGIVVEREDIILFFEDVLPKLGLNNKEKNEFIQFWLPIILRNKTNLVRFLSEEEISSKISKLEIKPKPETTIRVYMIFKELTESEQNIPTQDLTKLFKERSGYTCVEWGGTDL